MKNTMRTINKTFFHRNNVGNGTHLFKLKKGTHTSNTLKIFTRRTHSIFKIGKKHVLKKICSRVQCIKRPIHDTIAVLYRFVRLNRMTRRVSQCGRVWVHSMNCFVFRPRLCFSLLYRCLYFPWRV